MGYIPKTLIFLSAILPMITLSLLNMGIIGVFIAIILILTGWVITCGALKIAKYCAVVETNIASVEDKSSDIMFTLLSYILINTETRLEVTFIYTLFIGFAFWYSKIYFSNIYTALLGIRCYAITQNEGKTILILKKGNLFIDKKTYSVYAMHDGIYLWKEED